MGVYNPHSNGFPQSTLQMDVHNMDVQTKMDVHNGCPQSTSQMDVHNPHSKDVQNMDVHNPHSKWMSTIHTPNGCSLVFFSPGDFRRATTEVLFLPGKCSSLQF